MTRDPEAAKEKLQELEKDRALVGYMQISSIYQFFQFFRKELH